MPPIRVSYFTDPACPWSWAAEPALRALQALFGADVEITYIMGGLAREFGRPLESMRHVMDAAEASTMPVDPRLWLDHPPASSYPACLAVKAATEQGLDGPYLRVVREGLMARRQKLDGSEALTDVARRVPGLDVARFAIDLRSNAIVEAFGADLDRVREAALPDDARVAFPSFRVTGADGTEHWVRDRFEAAPLREAALAAGGEPAAPPGVEEALRRFGAMATVEVAAVCDLPGPRAAAELWRLASEWRVRADRVLTGELWTASG
ncbi:MAG TPA: DsbA family protein [Solirubrobacteraceae bacterium]|nr:DsbA family protein [Solirubrobacteraceae bacterium]